MFERLFCDMYIMYIAEVTGYGKMYELLFMTVLLTETNETKCSLAGESFNMNEYPGKLGN